MRSHMVKVGMSSAALALLLAATGACGDSNLSQAANSNPVPSHTRGQAAPPENRQGMGYPITLNTHCGIRFANFNGQTWATTPTLPEPKPRPPADGKAVYTGQTTGTFTLTSRDTAHFTVDTSKYIHDGTPVLFHVTDKQPTPCQ